MRTDAEMQELYEKARKVDIIDLLASYGYRPNEEGFYLCPFHNEKTPSASLLVVKSETKNRIKCFGCGKVATPIDVVMELEHCNNFEAVKKLLNLSYDKTNKNKEVIKLPLQLNRNNNIKKDHKPKKKHFTYEDGINMSNALGPKNAGYIKEHLKSRGILKLLEVGKDIGIELRHCYFNSKNHICYAFIKENLMIQKPIGERGKARNFGHSKPINFKRNDTKQWYIVEGIEDALTLIIYHNFNVVCLNSLSNIGKFIESINECFNLEEVEFIIATDYDDAGMEGLDMLDSFFKEKDIKYNLYNEFYNYIADHHEGGLKDVNDCLCYSKKLNIVQRRH